MPRRIEFEVLVDVPARTRATWDRWARETDVTPFASPAFFDAWSGAFRATRTPFVVTGTRDGELVFVMPLWRENRASDAWWSLGMFRADYSEALARDRDVVAQFWTWLASEAPCRSACIARAPAGSLLASTVPRAAFSSTRRALWAARSMVRSGRARYLWAYSLREHPFLDREAIAALATRVESKETRRKLNVLGRDGTVSYEVVRGKDAVLALLPRFFEMHVENFAQTGRESQFQVDEERAFYERLASSAELEGTTYMDVLRVGDRAAAIHLGFEARGCLYWYKPAFDPALAKGSPGRVLLAHIVARAFRENMHRIDLLKGTESYKTEWAQKTQTTVTTRLVDRRARELVQAVMSR